MKISSTNNIQIKNIIKLRKGIERKKQNLMIIEGYQEISIAISAGIEIKNVFYCEYLNKKKKTTPISLQKNIIEVEENVFKKISLRDNPDGFLATATPVQTSLGSIKLQKNPLVIILESVEKPGNLGAILRTADAVKADCLILSNPKTDIFNHNVIRSSLGTIFTNQIATGTNEEVIKWLRKNKIKIFAATPNTKKIYTESNLSGKVAIVIGTEHDGLSNDWLSQADEKIKIPMSGKIDSLNASVSAGVIVFEAFRQRTKTS